MMLLKKKEIIAASLVVLIGMAGYLNWSYQDTVKVRDNKSYVETGKMLGEAEMVSANNEVTESNSEDEAAQPESEETASEQTAENVMEKPKTFDESKMNREAARAAAMEALKNASSDQSIDEEARKLAGEKLVACSENIELESRVESIASSKGFEVCAYINEGIATVTVRSAGLTREEAVKLSEAVTSAAGITADKVRIIEVQ